MRACAIVRWMGVMLVIVLCSGVSGARDATIVVYKIEALSY